MKSTEPRNRHEIWRRWKWWVIGGVLALLAVPVTMCFLYVILPLIMNWVNGTE